jgi:hypothetical protein
LPPEAFPCTLRELRKTAGEGEEGDSWLSARYLFEAGFLNVDRNEKGLIIFAVPYYTKAAV